MSSVPRYTSASISRCGARFLSTLNTGEVSNTSPGWRNLTTSTRCSAARFTASVSIGEQYQISTPGTEDDCMDAGGKAVSGTIAEQLPRTSTLNALASDAECFQHQRRVQVFKAFQMTKRTLALKARAARQVEIQHRGARAERRRVARIGGTVERNKT